MRFRARLCGQQALRLLTSVRWPRVVAHVRSFALALIAAEEYAFAGPFRSVLRWHGRVEPLVSSDAALKSTLTNPRGPRSPRIQSNWLRGKRPSPSALWLAADLPSNTDRAYSRRTSGRLLGGFTSLARSHATESSAPVTRVRSGTRQPQAGPRKLALDLGKPGGSRTCLG